MNVVRSTFKPEFLNRLDEVVTFDALGTAELPRIVDLQLDAPTRRPRPPAVHAPARGARTRSGHVRAEARARGRAARRFALQVSDAAREWLGLIGYDPTYGAR